MMKYVKPRLNALKIQSAAGKICIAGAKDTSGGGACKNGPAPTGTCSTGGNRK